MEPDDATKAIATALVQLARAARGAAKADVRRLLPRTWDVAPAKREPREPGGSEIEEFAQSVAERAAVAAMVSAEIRALKPRDQGLGALMRMREKLARLKLRVVYSRDGSGVGRFTDPPVATYPPGGTLVVMLGETHWLLKSATTWGDQWISATGVRLDDLGHSRKSSGVVEPIVPLPSEATHRVSVVVGGAYPEPAIEGEKMHVLPLAEIRVPRSSGAVYLIQRHEITASTSFGSSGAPGATIYDEEWLNKTLKTVLGKATKVAGGTSIPLDTRKLVLLRNLLALKHGDQETAIDANVTEVDGNKASSVMGNIRRMGGDDKWAATVASADEDSIAFLETLAGHLLSGSSVKLEPDVKPKNFVSSICAFFSSNYAGAISNVMPPWLLGRILIEPRTRLLGVGYLKSFKDTPAGPEEKAQKILAAVQALGEFTKVILSDTCAYKTLEKLVQKAHEMCSSHMEHATALYAGMSVVIPGSPVLRIVRLYEYNIAINKLVESNKKTENNKDEPGKKNEPGILSNLEAHDIRGVEWYTTQVKTRPLIDASPGEGDRFQTALVTSVDNMHAYTKLQILLVGKEDDDLWLESFAKGHEALAEWAPDERKTIIELAMGIIEGENETAVVEALSESVAQWTEKNAGTWLVSEKNAGLAKVARECVQKLLASAIATKKETFDKKTTEDAIKTGLVNWLYQHESEPCVTARKIRDLRKKAGVTGNADAKRADRLVNTSILYSEIEDHNGKNEDDAYAEEEIDALHGAHDDLGKLGNPPCLPRVLTGEIDDAYVKQFCDAEKRLVPKEEEKLAKHIIGNDASILKKHPTCRFLSLYEKGKGELENVIKAIEANSGERTREVKISELFKVCGGKWRAPSEFLVSIVRKSDLEKFEFDSPVDKVHAAVLLGEIRGDVFDDRAESNIDNISRESSKSELVAYAARVLSAAEVNEGIIESVKKAYRRYHERVNKLDDADVFGTEYSPPWVRVPNANAYKKSNFGSSAWDDPADMIALGLGFRSIKEATLRDAYWTLSGAQRLDHAYVWRIFGFAGLVRMVRSGVQPVESIKATLTWIDASFKKSADEMVGEWKRASRKGDVQPKYVEKAVRCGVYEWEYGIQYFAERMEKSPQFAAWMDGIRVGRERTDAEYNAHTGATGKSKAEGLAVLVGTRIVGDVLAVLGAEAKTVQDEADLRLAHDAVRALTKLAEKSGIVTGKVQYYPLAHVTRIAERSGFAAEQGAVVALALSGVLFVVLDMLGSGVDAARLLGEYLAALDRQLAHDVADVMELVARIVEDNALFVSTVKALKTAEGFVAGSVSARSIAGALVTFGLADDPRSLAGVAAALREIQIPGAGRKMHTEIRKRADKIREVGGGLFLMRERGASRSVSSAAQDPPASTAERERDRASRSIMDVLSDMQMRTLHVTGGEVLVLEQEEPNPDGTPNVKVEQIVPGGYERRRVLEGVFATRFASVGGTVVGNATSWRGHLTGVCLVLVEDSAELGEKLIIQGEGEQNWRPIARVKEDPLSTRRGVVVMRGPRASAGGIVQTKVALLVVDDELAESIEDALDSALRYAAEGTEQSASKAAGVLAAQLRPMLWRKEPRPCALSVLSGAPTPEQKNALECVANAMALEYFLVRAAVRAFGLGAGLRPEVVVGASPVTGLVPRFAAWNKIAGLLADRTLARLVDQRKEKLARRSYDAQHEARAEAIDAAYKRAKEIIEKEKEDLKEPLGVLKHASAESSAEQKDLKAALGKGKLEDPELQWKNKTAVVIDASNVESL